MSDYKRMELLGRLHAYRDDVAPDDYGPLYVAMADGNMGVRSLLFCFKCAVLEGDRRGELLAEELILASEEDREWFSEHAYDKVGEVDER